MNTELILRYFSEFLDERRSLELVSYHLFEERGISKITLKVKDGDSIVDIDGAGFGMVDAGFNALTDHYSDNNLSLKTIKLEDVYFQVDHRAGKDVSFKSKMDVKLEFSNHCKDRTCFSGRTPSMGFTSVSVLVEAIEFYINCETSFKRLRFLLRDAESRGRHDVASKYKFVPLRVVEVTNYQTIVQDA